MNLQIANINYYTVNLSKHDDNSQKVLPQIEKNWPGWFQIYTDGSVNRTTGEAGIGVYAKKNDYQYRLTGFYGTPRVIWNVRLIFVTLVAYPYSA